MTRTKVLLISHNHPKLLAGGVEVYMAGLYEELRASPEFERPRRAQCISPPSVSSSHPGQSPPTPSSKYVGVAIRSATVVE